MFDPKAFAPILKTSASERLAQIPIRVLLAGLLSWALQAEGLARLIPLWLAVSAAVQLVEFFAMAPYRSKAPSGLDQVRRIAPALAAVLLMSAVHSAIGVFIWRNGDLTLATLGVLILAGGLLTNVGSGIESRALFLLGAAPYFAALAFMAVSVAGAAPASHVALLAVAVLLFVGAVYAVWARTHSSWRAEVVALAEAQTRLEQAEMAMADRAAMAAIVSHELRTPVSAILAGAHVIRTSDGKGDVASTADLIIDAARLMTGMLNDLLDHSKIEARAMTLEARDFDVQDFVRDAARFWTAPAAEKGLSFRTVLADEAPAWLKGDPYRLRQIVNNLISNAIKFTQHGEVALELGCGPAVGGARRLRLTVRDQGAGIAPEAMDRLFSPFAQASAEVARTYGGTGLGLTVSRELARLMGGDLTVESALGQGSAFTLDLTLPEGAPTVEESDYEAQPPELDRRMRVLAVDDHEINRRTLALVLQPLDIDLWTASEGQAALDILAEQAFDAVLMDVNMPGLDGLETTRRLRGSGGLNAAVPIIGFSAGAEAAQVAACYAAGMNDWLAKPLEPKKLYVALDRAMR